MVNVSAQSFERAMHHEATKSPRVTAPARTRECKQPSAPGEVPVKVLSDGGSTPPTSTKQKYPSKWTGISVWKNVLGELNGSGSEWSAGGAPEPRPGLPRRAGQPPPPPPEQDCCFNKIVILFFQRRHLILLLLADFILFLNQKQRILNRSYSDSGFSFFA